MVVCLGHFLTLKSLGAEVPQGAIYPPAAPQARALVHHDVPLIAVAPVEVQVLVFEAKQGLVLALPMLQLTLLVAFEEDHLDPVFDLGGCQTELEGQAEDAGLRGPAKLLLFGMRVTVCHGYGGSAVHSHALVVVVIEDEKRTTVCKEQKK